MGFSARTRAAAAVIGGILGGRDALLTRGYPKETIRSFKLSQRMQQRIKSRQRPRSEASGISSF